MLFHIGDLSVKGLQTTFNQDTSYLPPTPVDTTKSRLKIAPTTFTWKTLGSNTITT